MVRKMLFVFTMIASLSLSAAEKSKIAVLDFDANGVEKRVADMVTDLLATELVNSGVFEVAERKQVAKILNEQGLQQSGITEGEKAAEAGKMLNAKHLLLGTVGKLGRKIFVNVKVVGVSKGKIDFAIKHTARFEDELVKATEKIVEDLVLKITGKPLKKKEKPATVKKQSQKTKHDKKVKKPVKKKKYKNKRDAARGHAKDKFDSLDDL